MIDRKPFFTSALALAMLAAATPASHAVPYASAVRNTAGSAWEFVLNESADNVTVLRNGANPVNLGAVAAGRHTFDMTGFATFSIEVSKAAPVGWSTISDVNNPFTNYTIATGLAINNDPTSQFFGTVYVGNSSTNPTERGRAMGDGVYSLTADMKGVDLTNFAPIANANDAGLAKAPNWTVGPSLTAAPWRITLDDAGNLIVSDWSDESGGLKYAAPNLATGGLILAGEGGIDPISSTTHGSISSKAYVTGSVGNNLTVYAIDEDLGAPEGLGYENIWRWDVGNATNYDSPPVMHVSGQALDSLGSWITTVNGVRKGAEYSPQHEKWYLVQNRTNGAESGLFVVDPDEVDGFSPEILWESFQFTLDNFLDSDATLDDFQDVFRRVGDLTLSPDGTKLFLHRIAADPSNPYTGADVVMIIPLDENGVPELTVTEGAITNLETITTIGNNLGHASGAQLEFDAAGNLYVANSGIVTGDPNASAQLVQVLSPGGNTKAITTSAGAFSVVPFVPPANNSDFNNDGKVDGADFLTWQRGTGLTGQSGKATGDANGDGAVNIADYSEWAAHFGGAPAVGASGAVPEPTTVGLAALGALATVGAGRRRK